METSDESIISAYCTADSPQKAGTDIAEWMIFRSQAFCAPVQATYQNLLHAQVWVTLYKNISPKSIIFYIFGEKVPTKLKYFQNEKFCSLHRSIISSLCFPKIFRNLILVIATYNHLLFV